MLFNSVEFVLFAVLFYAAWPLARKRNAARWLYLCVFSFFFYGWWDWRFLGLLLGSGLVDFLAALAMVRWPRTRVAMLVASMGANIGTLALFKYLDFAVANTNWLLGLIGMDAQLAAPHLILPVGISFYTFQSMSYTIDVFRRQLTPTKNPLHFFAYLSLFPQLVAGPIVRAADLLPQLTSWRTTTEQERWQGTRLIAIGYFKKVVIADNLAPAVNAAFAASGDSGDMLYWWIIMAMFAFQIYGDFSGYSDIARGLGRWMGYDFCVNFNHPYGATSIREFWARWHISLSTWFRDYLYIPLGGSRGSAWRGHVNMWATMVTSGLWHGANWTFVIWGAIHAACLSLERATKWPDRLLKLPLGRHLAAALVMMLVLVSWVFFRATSFAQAGAVLSKMFSFEFAGLSALREWLDPDAALALAVIFLAELAVHLRLRVERLLPVPAARTAFEMTSVAALLVMSIYMRGPGSAFIYFQF